MPCRMGSIRIAVAAMSAVAMLAAATLVASAEEKEEKAEESKPVTYDDHVRPIFRQKCLSCHNTDKTEGGLDLSSYTAMMEGGGSGVVIEPGAASDSYLFMLVTHELEPHMPPESDRIDDKLVATLRDWIDGGALETAVKPITYDDDVRPIFAPGDPATGRGEGVHVRDDTRDGCRHRHAANTRTELQLSSGAGQHV
jgi:mono/diheme cytochrome c family protein